jgi:ribonuclease T2
VAPLRSHKSKVVLAVVVLGALLAWYTHRQSADSPVEPPVVPQDSPGKAATPAPEPTNNPARAKFDFYLLAMTLHRVFCIENPREGECRTRATRPLAIHGLWPENLEPRTYPHDCAAPALSLDPGLEQQLGELMPGMADGLHVHEWREHGGCSGLDDDVYFSRALDLARNLDAALAAKLTTLAGRDTTPDELRSYAELFRPGIGATFTLHCRNLREFGQRPVLTEIRQCVDDDGPDGAPGTLLDCATVNRRDQGCGSSFLVAGSSR